MSNTFFGQHVHRAAFLLSAIGVFASVFTASFYFYDSTPFPRLHVILSLIAFLCYLLLIVGNYIESAALYYPFLLIIPFCILAQLLNAFLIFFIIGIELTTGRRQIIEDPDLSHVYSFVRAHPEFTYDALRPPHVLVLLLGLIYLLAALFQIYFYVVVIRALRYMRKIENGRFLEEITWSRRVH
ncbi:hypothetical protein M3Y99_00470500 [Aphelenchoides fujianensis]|nr:hypothetical protein M3Y99_00470500 [Aphelenchoides fujianensis]